LNAVAAITSRLSRKIRISRSGELVGLAHDLGKCSEAFQDYLGKVAGAAAIEMEPDLSLKGSVDHSTAGPRSSIESSPHLTVSRLKCLLSAQLRIILG
jgi:CRISPR-associated endonuclease/helicase Cas3